LFARGDLMHRFAFAPLIALVLAGVPTHSVQEKHLQVGQEWQFEGRPADPDPTLIIVRIEELPTLGEVVHVSVRGVRINNPRVAGGFSDNLPHMPFSRAAIQRSVTKLVHDSVALPSYEAGYEQWKKAHGGVFTISVREALDFAERAIH